MDIPRTPSPKRFRYPMVVLASAGLLAVLLGLGRLRPALPGADRQSLLIATVKRGPLTLDVKANGTLAAVDLRIITAQTPCTVERIHVYPGASVHPDTVLAELSSPELQQAALDAMWQLRSAEAEYQVAHLNQKAVVDAARANAQEAQATLDAYLRLQKEGLQGGLDVLRARARAEELTGRLAAEEARLRLFEGRGGEVAPARARLEQARAMHALKQSQVASLKVRAGLEGLLQQLPLQVGQQCNAGGMLAIVAKPLPLKAELKVSEIQAKDVQIGLPALIDTRNGIVRGRVIRMDPSIRNGTVTVDVRIEEPLPPSARLDLSVEGTIQLDHVPDCAFLSRPNLVQTHSSVALFKLSPDGGEAQRVKVRFGRGSFTDLEVLDGLAPGDQVIVSDTSAFEGADRIRIH